VKKAKEIAAEEGYENGRFTFRRLAADTRRVEEWIACMKRGVVHEDLASLGNSAEMRDLVAKEALALSKEEREWAPFFHATMKATDMTVTGDLKHDHKHTHEQLSETAEWIAELLGRSEEKPSKESVQD